MLHEFDFSWFRTILLSVVSLLNEPNTSSPANVDASVMFRRWKDSKGKDKEYENIIRYRFIKPNHNFWILKLKYWNKLQYKYNTHNRKIDFNMQQLEAN